MVAGEESVVLHQAVEFGKAQAGARQGRGDRRLVRGTAEKTGNQNAIEQDHFGNAGPGIGIDDADDLVHPRPFVHVFGLQRRARKSLVDIAHDRLGLV